MMKFLKSIQHLRKVRKEAYSGVKHLKDIEIESFLNQWMRENTKYQDPKKLNKFDYGK